MKILFTGNCQCDGLAYFMRRALQHWEIRSLPHLATFYQEFSEERIAEEHAWADLVFFHYKHDGKQDYPTKQPKIPLSVWYQSAPFMAQIPQEMWDEFKEDNRLFSPNDPNGLIEYLVKDHDFDYEKRWNDCWTRMQQKEVDENVTEELRISDWMEVGKVNQLQLTCNHPTSKVFFVWSLRIMKFLGVENHSLVTTNDELEQNPNLAGLPCEESATSGARKHLSLSWGGRPEDDESGRQIARERLK